MAVVRVAPEGSLKEVSLNKWGGRGEETFAITSQKAIGSERKIEGAGFQRGGRPATTRLDGPISNRREEGGRILGGNQGSSFRPGKASLPNGVTPS